MRQNKNVNLEKGSTTPKKDLYVANARRLVERMRKLGRNIEYHPIDLSEDVIIIKEMIAKAGITLVDIGTCTEELKILFKRCFKRHLESKGDTFLLGLSEEELKRFLESKATIAWARVQLESEAAIT